MKCLVLAAGYATRLYPLTENFPKPLLKVKGKAILEWLLEDINRYGVIDEYIIISNHKYADKFEEWASEYNLDIKVLDDGTDNNETRLGAVKDIEFAIEKLSIDDDLLVIAGDNVLDFSLGKFIGYAMLKDASCVMRYAESDLSRLKKSGVAEIDSNERIINFTEKSPEPKSNWCVPPFYIYTRSDAALIKNAINDGCGTDAPGSLVSWMAMHTRIYAMEMPGKRYDIGDQKSYSDVCESYRGIINE